MENPMLLWYVVVGIVLMVVSLRFALTMRHPRHHHVRHHLVELGRERDMFFIPGDVPAGHDDEDDDDC